MKQVFQSLIVLFFLVEITSSAATLNTDTSSCPCDQVQGIAEYLCCCDADYKPSTDLIKPSSCIDKNYGDVFQIPFYTDLQSKASSIDDLYSPFRLAYQVIKTLGSAMDRNKIQASIDFQLSSPSETKEFATILSEQLKNYTYYSLPKFLQPEQRVYNKFKRTTDNFSSLGIVDDIYVNMFVRDEATGNCLKYVATEYETVPFFSCNMRQSDQDSYQSFVSKALVPTDRCLILNNNFELVSTPANALTAAANSCQSQQPMQAVGFVYTNDSADQVNKMIYITVLKAQAAKYANLFFGGKIYYDYGSYTEDIAKPKRGYNIGDPLIFYDSKYVQKGLPFNDIFSPSGTCYTRDLTGLTYNMIHQIDLQFGKNQTISCLISGTSNEWQANTFLLNTKQIGRFANANPKYKLDWVTYDTYTQNDKLNFVLKIYYAKQGKDTNPTYRITKVTPETIASSVTTQKAISILFYEEPQDTNFFMAAAPQLDNKLPRNILYPFFTFEE